MNKLYILRGFTSGGKSFLIDKLSHSGYKYIKEDEFRKNSNYPKGHDLHVTMGSEAMSILNRDKSDLIVEGPFHKSYMIERFFNNCGRSIQDLNVHIIRLECSLETVLYRNKLRENPLDEQLVIERYSKQTFPSIDKEIIFNTDNGIEEAYNFIVNTTKNNPITRQ